MKERDPKGAPKIMRPCSTVGKPWSPTQTSAPMQAGQVGWLGAGCVPNSGFAAVEPDMGMGTQNDAPRDHKLGGRGLAGEGCRRHPKMRKGAPPVEVDLGQLATLIFDPMPKKAGIMGVALFPAFGLSDGVGFAVFIVPDVLRSFCVEEPDKRQALVGFWNGVGASQHTVSGDGVVCPDAIYG